jgi:hypothetical protein
MNPFLTIVLGLIPIIGVPALLIGLFALMAGRSSRRSESPSEVAGGRVVSAPSGQLRAAMELEVQLTTVLAESGEALLGYRTSAASATSIRSSTDVFPLATGILLVRPRDEDGDTAFSTLDRWSKDGIELTLRAVDDSDVVDLCDRQTSQSLVLSVLRAPCD